MNFIVVGYYTVDTPYEHEARRLISSAIKFNVPYHVCPVESKGDWYKNTQYKATFVRAMMDQFPDSSIVYVDVDAEFLQYPSLFFELNARSDVHLGAHLLDHRKRGRDVDPEFLSGTLFFKNSDVSRQVVNQWIGQCSKGGQLWDQTALWAVVRHMNLPFYILPEEYCTIFDYMRDVKNPVIRHYQASRKNKNSTSPVVPLGGSTSDGSEVKQPLTQPRKVAPGGLRRIPRTWR